MRNMDLGMLILAGVCGIGAIQLLMWIVLMIRQPEADDFRLDFGEAAPTQPSGGESAARSHTAGVVE
jgi:hypothetical protein